MDYSLASDKQLRMIAQYDPDCSPSLLEGLAIEMIRRRLWDGIIMYAAKQTYYNVRETLTTKLQMNEEEFIHIAHIHIIKMVERFQPGRRNFKSYIIMCLISYFKHLRRDAEALKRKANLYTENVDGLDPKLQESMFQSPVNVEKYVIDKITLEEYLKPLREVERQALYLEAMGYTQFEIAEKLGFANRHYGNVLMKRVHKKLKKMGA
jgi:RNA polymerase sigma factor (sigma-70 family)